MCAEKLVIGVHVVIEFRLWPRAVAMAGVALFPIVFVDGLPELVEVLSRGITLLLLGILAANEDKNKRWNPKIT
jgi:hypothetical protein